MAFRFVHAADVHLDSPLRTLALRDADAAQMIADATRDALIRIVDLCLEEQVDALILAGDLYDGDQTSMKTALFLASQLRRLDDAGVQTFIIRGNHDAASKITRELVFPPNVKLFAGHAEAIEITRPPGATPVVVHGLSFGKPHAPQSLLGKFRAPAPGAINIGIMHTSLGGAEGHDVYAPCTVAELHATGFDYWALGHIHKRAVHVGAATIVMPGNPQGRDINEAGPRSATLVSISDSREVTLEERITSSAEFARADVDLTGAASREDVAARLHRSLAELRTQVRSPHLVARLRLGGQTDMASWVRRDADILLEEARLAAARLDQCIIDKLEIGPDLACPATGVADDADPTHELAHIVQETVLPSAAFATLADSCLKELLGQLPAELRDIFDPPASADRTALLENLAREGAAEALAHLQSATPEHDA